MRIEDRSWSPYSRPTGKGPNRRRVLFLSITFSPEPGPTRGLPLAKWLFEQCGYDVCVLTAIPWYPVGKFYPNYRCRLWQWESMDGIAVLRVPLFPSHDLSAVRRALTYISFSVFAALLGPILIGRVDVVYFFDNLPTTGTVAWLFRLLFGAKSVMNINDLWPDTVVNSGMIKSSMLLRSARYLIDRWMGFLYARNECITVLSPGFKRVICSRGVPPSRVRIVYNWADEDLFYPTGKDNALARSLGLSGKFNIVYSGNIGPMQALDSVVRAAAEIRSHAGIQIVIIGAGPSERQVRDLAHALRASNVRFVGRRPLSEMNRINALSDVLLVSLKDHGFLHSTIPHKIQVGMASGRPILISARGDAVDLVLQSGAGMAVEPENPRALSEAILRFAGLGQHNLSVMGANGRRYYEGHLSFRVGALEMASIFDSFNNRA